MACDGRQAATEEAVLGSKGRSRRLAFAMPLLAALALAYAGAFQGTRGLWEPDEGRYTDIALEMLHSGDFVVPAFNHDVAHFAKPPLTYWAIAGGITLAGRNEWGVRLPNTLAFAGTLALVYLLGARLLPRRPWLPALVWATSLLPYGAANVVTTDTLLTFFETLAAAGFVTFWERRGRAGWRPPLFLMWCAFGLAFLTKGPVGLLPLLAFAAFAGAAGGWPGLASLFCAGGLTAFAAVGLGWYAFVALIEPGLTTYFLRDEFARRITSGAYRRNAQWYGALWTYGPTLLAGTLPWTFVLAGRARSGVRSLLDRRWWRARLAAGSWAPLLVLWVAAPLACLAVSRSRLPLYALPLFVPLALLVAAALGDRPLPRRWAPALALWAVALIALRALSAHLPNPQDARRFAAAIAAQVRPLPREVVFVDERPLWGVGFYLDCEVERILTMDPPGGREPDGVSNESLVGELVERERRVLLVVPPSRAETVAKAFAKLGRPFRPIATAGELLLVPAGSDLTASADPQKP